MIATLSTVAFIVSESLEITANTILQKGDAISRTGPHTHQLYHYTLFASTSQTDSSSNRNTTNEENPQPFEHHAVYILHGKFAPRTDDSLDIVVTSHRRLEISPDDMPISMPFVHLLGRTENTPIKSKAGYQVGLQVKPYLSKQQCGTVTITLVHPPDGRFKNALEKTRNFSLVHAMGTLLFHKNKPFCDILEYQFVSTKTDDTLSTTIPWKSNDSVGESSQSLTAESPLQRRIAALENDIQETLPSQTATKREQSPTDTKGKGKQPRIAEIAHNLLAQSQQNQPDDELDEPVNQNSVEVQDGIAETVSSPSLTKRGRPKRLRKISRK
jgi:hypothetical protein